MRSRGFSEFWVVLALTGPMMATGCGTLDSLVTVDPPDRITAETFETPANAAIIVAGVIGNLECALASYIVGGGATADELSVNGGNVQWFSYDRRSFETSGLLGAGYAISTCANQGSSVGVYRPLSTARWSADNALEHLEGWTDAEVPNRSAQIATAAAHAGYAYLLLGESMCAAAIDLGPALPPAELFQLADERFTTAIGAAGTAAEILNMARVGRARTRLDLGRKADAAADANLVPAGFVRNATYSDATARRRNAVFFHNRSDVVGVEGPFRARTDMGAPDPRVKVTNTGRFFAGNPLLPIWYEEKYTSRAASIPIARTAEARLIVAEAAVAAGDLQAAIDIINALHAQPGVGLPPFSAATAAEVLAHLIDERAAELWLEGQRLMDVKRFNLPLVPAPGAAFPLGGIYGGQTCYPLPAIETDNNPNAD